MKRPPVVFAPEARDDLVALYDWIAIEAGPTVALPYIERLETHCLGLSHSPNRGQARDDLRPGLRIEGFERRLTLAFAVEDNRVIILRLFYAGRNWETDLS